MAGKLQIGIIGLGKFGFRFGKALVDLGHDVVGVDTDMDRVKMAQNVFTQVYQADAIEKQALEQIGFADMTHALISVGESIAASAMISMYLKEMGVPSVWVKAINDDHRKLLLKIGVDRVIIPEYMAAKEFAHRLAVPGFIEYLPFDRSMALKELTVKNWTGKTLKDLDLTNKYGIQVIAIKADGSRRFRFIPRADIPLREGQVLVALGKAEVLGQVKP